MKPKRRNLFQSYGEKDYKCSKFHLIFKLHLVLLILIFILVEEWFSSSTFQMARHAP